MRFLLVGNGPQTNRGCQAIEMTTRRMLRAQFPNVSIVIGDESGGLDQAKADDATTQHHLLTMDTYRRDIDWFGYQLFKRSRYGLPLTRPWQFVARHIPGCDVVLSLGGDLYGPTYGDWQLAHYLALGDCAFSHSVPFVIWPATIGPFDQQNPIHRKALAQIERADLVLCRDEWSMDHLTSCGVKGKLRLVADPAFLLEPERPDKAKLAGLPDNLSDYVGINLSPYIAVEATQGASQRWITLATQAVHDVITATHVPVILIPHVGPFRGNTTNCDYTFLSAVAERLKNEGLYVPVVPISLNAAELKWVIAQLRAFVGARTHSTIAAFGSGVPTACIGYSAKAKAFCLLFYGDDNLCLPGRSFTSDALVTKVKFLLQNDDSLRARIMQKLPEIRRRAALSGEYLQTVLNLHAN
jgi:colanic acid/amylovoran biosynthesis protein